MPRHRGCKLAQRVGEEVRQYKIEQTGLRKARRTETDRMDSFDILPGAVEAGVFPGHDARARIDIAGENGPMQRLGGSDGQHAGAGAEVEHAGWRVLAQHPVEQHEAAARGAVVPGAASECSLDLDPQLVRRDPFAVMLAMDD